MQLVAHSASRKLHTFACLHLFCTECHVDSVHKRGAFSVARLQQKARISHGANSARALHLFCAQPSLTQSRNISGVLGLFGRGVDVVEESLRGEGWVIFRLGGGGSCLEGIARLVFSFWTLWILCFLPLLCEQIKKSHVEESCGGGGSSKWSLPCWGVDHHRCQWDILSQERGRVGDIQDHSIQSHEDQLVTQSGQARSVSSQFGKPDCR
jgi:hypothetical protein